MSAHNIPMTVGTISTPSTLDLSRIVVRLVHTDRQQQTFQQIKATVAEAFKVSMEQLDSRRRDARVALARQVAMHLCRELGDGSLRDIGHAFKRHHVTVINASTHVQNLMETEPRVREQIQRLQAQVRGM